MKPFQQGDLDSTCGLYAVVNAIRFAASAHNAISAKDSAGLLFKLVAALDKKYGMANIIQDGMYVGLISFLLHVAKAHLSITMGLDLSWTKPFHNRPAKSLTIALRVVDEHLSHGGSVIIGTEGKHDHWTVVQKVKGRSLILADSNGLKCFALSKVYVAAKLKTNKLHRLCTTSLFLLRCQDRHNRNTKGGQPNFNVTNRGISKISRRLRGE